MTAWPLLAGLLLTLDLLVPAAGVGHPMGNFSINHYAELRPRADALHLHYLIDMAEIPTFQEVQATGIVPRPGHPSLKAYLAAKLEALKTGLTVELDGRPLELRSVSADVIFPQGAGGLPTLKLEAVYRAALGGLAAASVHELRYRDGNFPDRAGWKEVVAVEGPGIVLVDSSAPGTDRSGRLTDYPTDPLNGPPQDLEARLSFARRGAPPAAARPSGGSRLEDDLREANVDPAGVEPASPEAPSRPAATPPSLGPNRQATPRGSFTELMTADQLGPGLVLLAFAVAAALGAFHALEPGHGKTVVAAYLVGSRGTARHALLLGLIVTAAHTAGVYLLGAVTLYASRHVVPERLYPWLACISGLAIATVGVSLFVRRCAGRGAAHAHDHGHGHPHGPGEHHGHDGHGTVSATELLALGVSGGIVPCPAALVVLLSAVSLHRVGFGLLLIVAFSVGLAAVLIGLGLLMIYARRFVARLPGEGVLITRWLPLTSSVVITLFGVALTVQALAAAGVLRSAL